MDDHCLALEKLEAPHRCGGGGGGRRPPPDRKDERDVKLEVVPHGKDTRLEAFFGYSSIHFNPHVIMY
jgi:hypothetical protein